VEALLRWNSALLGSVPPSEFIPIAEETGLIRSLGAWVLEQACAQWMRWQDSTVAGGALMGVGLSVNLSAVQLADPSGGRHPAVLERTGMPEQHLELEITESQLMEAPSVADQVVALKLLGVQLSIDDFGTGYSSLAYLKRFDIDRLKIDKSFVRDMLDDPADLAITRAIISLGHSLGLKVVAEGWKTAPRPRCSARWPAKSCRALFQPALAGARARALGACLPRVRSAVAARHGGRDRGRRGGTGGIGSEISGGLLRLQPPAGWRVVSVRGHAGGLRHGLGAGGCAGPGPLEVVAAQPAGDVHHLANKVQAGLGLALHGLLRQCLGVHAAQRDLGLFVALGARGRDFPARELVGQLGQGLVAGLVDGALQLGVLGHPGIGQARGHVLGQLVGHQLARLQLGAGQQLRHVHAGQQVDVQRCAVFQ
jgi:EAL domain-containing protein (putative c-di-GMP-specific phosphodiesterase class I)